MRIQIIGIVLVAVMACSSAQKRTLSPANEAFLIAATAVDIPGMQKALQNGADINIRDENGRTAAILVAFSAKASGPAAAIQMLKAAGIDFQLVDTTNRTALQWAQINRSSALIELEIATLK